MVRLSRGTGCGWSVVYRIRCALHCKRNECVGGTRGVRDAVRERDVARERRAVHEREASIAVDGNAVARAGGNRAAGSVVRHASTECAAPKGGNGRRRRAQVVVHEESGCWKRERGA